MAETKEGAEQIIRKVSMQKHLSKEKQDWQDEDNYKQAIGAALTVEQRETINQERRRHQQLNCGCIYLMSNV